MTDSPPLGDEAENGDLGDLAVDDVVGADDAGSDLDDDGPEQDYDGPAPIAAGVLQHIVASIVDDPSAVQVDGIEGRNRVKLEVRVADGDLGRVIGRRGRTAQSIRTVVRAAATRDGVEVDVDFAD